MNPLLLSQTNRESFAAMCMLKVKEDTNSFQASHSVLQDTPQNGGKKETGKAGRNSPRPPFPPPVIFQSRSLKKNWRDDPSVLLSHYGCWPGL